MTMRARFVVQNLSRLNGWQIEIYRSTVNADIFGPLILRKEFVNREVQQ
jgi:hypothetical protein